MVVAAGGGGGGGGGAGAIEPLPLQPTPAIAPTTVTTRSARSMKRGSLMMATLRVGDPCLPHASIWRCARTARFLSARPTLVAGQRPGQVGGDAERAPRARDLVRRAHHQRPIAVPDRDRTGRSPAARRPRQGPVARTRPAA